MASLTRLSKTLISLVVVGGVASVVWHLGLKDRFGGTPASVGSSQQTAPATPPVSPAPPVPPAVVAADPVAPVPPAAPPPASPPAGQGISSGLSPAEHSEAGRKLMAGGQFEQARAHLEQAVQGGDGAAACLLGEMTLKGQGGLQANQDKAAALFRLAQSKNLICFASGS